MSKSKPAPEIERQVRRILEHYSKQLQAGAVYFDLRTGQRLTDVADVLYAIDAGALTTEPPQQVEK